MQSRLKRQITGKRGECKVFVQLLGHGLILYIPLVDEGIDCLLRAHAPIGLSASYSTQRGLQYHNQDLNRVAFNERVVRPPGFEPGSSTWQADVLDQTRLRPLQCGLRSSLMVKVINTLLRLRVVFSRE